MMANGALVRVLIHTGVTKYMSFKAVDGSYVFNKGKVQPPFLMHKHSIFIDIFTV
jgi:RAB protein geranylgeranyltransferase component A